MLQLTRDSSGESGTFSLLRNPLDAEKEKCSFPSAEILSPVMESLPVRTEIFSRVCTFMPERSFLSVTRKVPIVPRRAQ